MATITRKRAVAAISDQWQQAGEPVEMQNGTEAQRWTQPSTGLSRIIPVGLHPDDQPNGAALAVADVDDFDDEPQEETATDRVATMLADAKSAERGEIYVYKKDQGGKAQYCKKYSADEFENGGFEMLRNQFGPGDFEINFYAVNPLTRKFAIRRRTSVSIAGGDMAPKTGGMDAGLAQVMQTIAQGQQQMLEALTKQQPQRDPMEEMTRMVTLMATMREAMGINNQQSQKSTISELIEGIHQLRGAAAEIIPQEKEPDSMMGMLPQILGIISNSQEQAKNAAPVAMNPIQLPVSYDEPSQAPAPNPTITDDPQLPTDEMKSFAYLKLMTYLKTLLDMAEKNETVDAGAQFVYDKLPDDLIDILALDNCIELLKTLGPIKGSIEKHETWLKAVRDKSLGLFDSSEGEPA